MMMTSYDVGMIVAKINAEPISVSSVTQQGWDCGLTREVSYINGTKNPICVREQDGFTICLDPNRGATGNGVTIIVSYPRKKDHGDIERTFERHDIMEAEVADRYRGYYTERRKGGVFRMRNGFREEIPIESEQIINGLIVYRLFVPAEYLEELDKFIYVKEVGTVVYRPDLCPNPMHPHSDEGEVLRARLERKTKGAKHAFTYYVEINDHNDIYGERFLNVNGEIFKIRPINRKDRKEGIYVYRSRRSGSLELPEKDEIISLSEENLINLGVYKTHADAFAQGDNLTKLQKRNGEMEKEIAALKEDLKRSKDDFQLKITAEENRLRELKIKAEKDAVEREAEKTRYEHLLGLERLLAREEYEERSARRKDSGELLKIIPAIIVGIGAIFLALKNIFGKK